MTERQAFTRAFENLLCHAPRTPSMYTCGDISLATSPTSRLPYDLNIMPGIQGGQVLIASFSDWHQSVHILLPGVAEACARAMGCHKSQLMFLVTFGRSISISTSLYAVRCDDMININFLYTLTSISDRCNADQGTATQPAQHGHEASPVHVCEGPGSLLASLANVQPYPGIGQQHGLKIADVTYMPWPIDNKQATALMKHRQGGLTVLAARDRSTKDCQMPIVAAKACFKCSTDKPQLSHVCARCNHARYCNKACQAADWGLHKAYCRSYKAMYSNAGS